MKNLVFLLSVAIFLSFNAFSQINIDSVGNVGIGTAIPATLLDIQGNPSSTLNVMTSTVNSSDSVQIRAIIGTSIPYLGFGIGVEGTGGSVGVQGVNTSAPDVGGSGVRGLNTVNGDATGYGGYFSSTSNSPFGAIASYGVYGSSSNPNGFYTYGLYGLATSNSNGLNAYGVYGKAVGAQFNWAGYFDGKGYFSDSLGIGTSAPSAKLDVEGTFQLKDGTEADKLILTSDSDGNASWQNLSTEALFGSDITADFDCIDTVGSLSLGASPTTIEIENNLVYVCAGSQLQIIDIQNPTSPILLGSLNLSSPRVYSITGNHAYLLDGDTLKIVDVSNPMSPALVGSIFVDANFECLAASDNYAYICRTIFDTYGNTGEVKVIDVTNKSTPSIIATLPISYEPNRIRYKENYVYIIGRFTPGSPLSSASKFGVYDVSNANSPVQTYLATLSAPSSQAWNLELTDSYALVTHALAASQQLSIYDLSNPATPSYVGGNPTVSQPVDLSPNENYMFAVEFSDLRIYDVPSGTFNKYQPLPISGGIIAAELNNNYLYILTSANKLVVVILSCQNSITVDPVTAQISSITSLWQSKEDDIYNSNSGNVGIGTSAPTAKLDVAGNVKITDGTEGAGKILTSNANGLASWSGKTKSYSILPTMLNSAFFSGGAAFGFGPVGQPCIIFQDGLTQDVNFTFPIPSNFNASTVLIKVFYSGSIAGGTFDCSLFSRGRKVGEVMTLGTGSGGLVIPGPSGVDVLMEGFPAAGIFSSNDDVLHFALRRRGGTGTDTNSGDMKFYGITIEYTE